MARQQREADIPLMSIDPSQRQMKSLSVLILTVIALSGFLAACQSAGSFEGDQRLPVTAGPLKPFKEDKFAYRAPLEVRDGGDYAVIPYDELKDINERDEIPVRKVRSGYVRKLPSNAEHDFTYVSDGRKLKAFAAGRLEGARSFTVIYLHGRDGNREWGFDDERFGGNFNRLKNLITAAGGLYLSPDFTDFDQAGKDDIASLIDRFGQSSRKLVLACGSLGGKICWSLLTDPRVAPSIDGAVFLGGFPNDRFAERAGPNGPPIVLAHGSRDPVYSLEAMLNFYEKLRAKGQPVRMRVFQTGNHGTPVRMIDWRDTLNWILTR